MRSAAERVVRHETSGGSSTSGCTRTGLMDYAVDSYGVTQDASGSQTAVARRATRRAAASDAGRRADAVRLDDRRTIQATGDSATGRHRDDEQRPERSASSIRITSRGTGIGATTCQSACLITLPRAALTFNWPYLDQTDRAKTLVALAPAVWYSQSAGHRPRRSREDELPVDGRHPRRRDSRSRRGIRAIRSRAKRPNVLARAQRVGARRESRICPGFDRPLMGYGGDVNYLDGLFKVDAYSRTGI